MKEDFLHLVWKTKNFNLKDLKTTDGQNIVLYKSGNHNHQQGPDFFEAEMEIDGIKWFGAVEIHIKTSDWIRHSHQNDNKYQQVILHVVYEHDTIINDIPVLELKSKIKFSQLSRYEEMMELESEFPCEKTISKIERIVKENTISKMLFERLEEKFKKVLDIFEKNNFDMEQTSLEVFISAFGFNNNREGFEQLSKIIKFKEIYRHQHQPFQIQALLFGSAGFLQLEPKTDPYYDALKEEFNFLSKKYSIKSLDYNIWNFGKMRPSNFPTIRIAQIASILSSETNLYSKFMGFENFMESENFFKKEMEAYWMNHFTFNKVSGTKIEKEIGKSTIELLVINCVVPILYASGKYYNNDEQKRKAISMLETTKFENNKITKKLKPIIGFNRDASDSQALIYLFKNYCEKKQCLRCNIGVKTLNS